MASVTVDPGELKALIKEALLEVLEERPDVVAHVVAEALEDAGLLKAIQEGEKTEEISRDEVMKALER
ncbi:MAG: hypothetical protein ACODAJ_13720 [Planctomycetota bacterium]